MYTNSESIPYYFKYFVYSYLNVTFWPIMGEDTFFIMDLKKLNWNLHEYITYRQVSIYLFVGSLTQNMSNLRLAIYLQDLKPLDSLILFKSACTVKL